MNVGSKGRLCSAGVNVGTKDRLCSVSGNIGSKGRLCSVSGKVLTAIQLLTDVTMALLQFAIPLSSQNTTRFHFAQSDVTKRPYRGVL